MKISKITFKLILPILAVLCFYIFGPFVIYIPQVSVFILLIIIIFCTFIGCKFGTSSAMCYRARKSNSDRIIINYAKFMAPLIFMSTSYYIFWLLSSGLGVEQLLNNLSGVRGSLLERDITIKLVSIFAFQSFPLIILLTYHRKDIFSKSVKYLLITSFILMGFASILQAGRTFFLFSFILIYSVYSVYIKSERKNLFSSKFTKIIMILFIFLGLVMITYIQLNRPSSATIREISQTVKFSYGDNLIENYLGPTFKYLLISFYGYTTAPFNNFLILADVSTRLLDDNHTILNVLMCKFNICQDASNEIDSYRLSTYYSYLAKGGEQTGWGTALSVWLNMYGQFGVVFFSLGLSFLYGLYLKRFQMDKSMMNYFNIMFVCYLILNSIFEFPIDSIFFAFIFVKVYVAILGTLVRKKRITNENSFSGSKSKLW